jgi:hypothetical protein
MNPSTCVKIRATLIKTLLSLNNFNARDELALDFGVRDPQSVTRKFDPSRFGEHQRDNDHRQSNSRPKSDRNVDRQKG